MPASPWRRRCGSASRLTLAGLVELWFFTNPLAAMVALVTMLTYLIWYTPLKLRSSLSTIVGAIPGALPALIGWAAATNTLSLPGWGLFAHRLHVADAAFPGHRLDAS